MPKLNFKAPANSGLVNDAFAGRDSDDTITGKWDLENTDASSGDSISNLQRQVNANKLKVMAAQQISNLDTITTDDIATTQNIRLSGDGGPQNVSTTPFGNTINFADGSVFYIVGQSDTNTVTLTYNNSDYGAILNGDITLKLGECLTLQWDAGILRFIELGRNI